MAEDEELDEDDVLLARMDVGLYTLQQVRACVLGVGWGGGQHASLLKA